jgi:hypothetical protein
MYINNKSWEGRKSNFQSFYVIILKVSIFSVITKMKHADKPRKV